jgi:integrase
LVEDQGARAALFGTEKVPSVRLSEVFPKFEHQTRNEVRDMSLNQLKRWKNGYILAITDFIRVVGDKALNTITHADIRDYIEWLEGRIEEDEIVAKTANKYIGHCSKMIKSINLKFRLGLPDFFSGQRLQGVENESRPPFPIEFVQNRILADGALMGMNDEARRAVMLMADTGLRLSEAVNLNERTIHLDCDIPYIEVLPDGRRVKTRPSIREIPLVGTALAAMKLQRQGFPRYVDKGASFSAYVNGYLLEAGLRPTRKHTVYSLRHTFKDRLIAAQCQDSMIESLMGHSDDHPKYGSGPALDLKHKVLHAIAFNPPATL